jgi:hypothetical protein
MILEFPLIQPIADLYVFMAIAQLVMPLVVEEDARPPETEIFAVLLEGPHRVAVPLAMLECKGFSAGLVQVQL